LVTVTSGSVVTTNLGLPAGYFAYALGTGSPSYDPHAAAVGLLLHFDGQNNGTSFPDSSPNNLPPTLSVSPVPPVTSTLHKEFGTASCFLNNTGYVSYPLLVGGPIDIFSAASSDFTLEFWIFAGTQAEAAILYTPINSDGPGGMQLFYQEGNGKVVATLSGTDAASANGSVPPNTWTSCALTCTSNVLQWWINGVASGSAPTVVRGIAVNDTLQVGGSSVPSSTLVGYIDELRITKGFARYSGTYTPASQPFPTSLTITYNNSAPFLLKEIHFAAPYLGGIYVVAEFNVTDSTLLAEFGSVFHYWIQSSTGGSNSNEWQPNTDYQIGSVVIPDSPNGLTYVASRHLPPNPVWTPNTIETVGNIVEPTVANGFKFTVTATLGATPTTGETEPTWPTSDGATVLENSSLANDQTVVLAVAANAVTAPSVPARYSGLFAP
jgi:hypothetical protein